MIFNYIRVSTLAQNTDRQLFDVPCDRIYEDKLSGKDMNRPEFQSMLANLRAGDVVNVRSLDRLGRNVKHLLETIEQITSKGAVIKFHKENLSFSNNEKSDPFQKLMLVMLGAIAEFERSLILERQREGIAIAKAKKVYKGGKRKLTDEQVEEMKSMFSDNTISKAKIAERFNITRKSVYNYCQL